MRALVAFVLLLAACGSKKDPALSQQDRDRALTAATQCTVTIESLAPSYQSLGPKLAATLKMDRIEAKRLMRDSIELLIATREMLCNLSAGTVETIHAKAPRDKEVAAARDRVQVALARLADARKAYDELLGAASAPQPPVDEAALLDRFSRALVGH